MNRAAEHEQAAGQIHRCVHERRHDPADLDADIYGRDSAERGDEWFESRPGVSRFRIRDRLSRAYATERSRWHCHSWNRVHQQQARM